MLTEFNTGGRHEENPNGGIPQGIGQNGQPNTVEQGETKKENFVYSDRLYINEDLAKESYLPKYIKGKTFAEASKIINNKFKDRNDNHSNSTKKELLNRLSGAQEYLKMQEQQINESMQANMSTPEYPEQNQMFLGGDGTPLQVLQGIGSSGALGQHTGINQATTALDLAQTAFGKTGIDTSGATNVDPGSIKPGMMGVTSALKGAQAGAMFGPIGTGVGAAIGLGAGLIGGFKAKKDALKAHQNFEIGQSNNLISNFAFGGNLGDPLKPSQFDPTKEDFLPVRKIIPITSSDGSKQYQYFYGKIPGEDGYDIDMNSHIYTSDEHIAKQNKQHPEYSERASNYLNKTNGLLNRDITKFSKGGNIYTNGGPFDKSMASYDPNNINSTTQPINNAISGITNWFGNPKSNDYISLSDKELTNPVNTYSNPELAPENINKFNNTKFGQTLGKTGNWLNDNSGNLLRYSPIAMNAMQLAKMNKPEVERLNRLGNRYNPQYMDERQLTNQINAESNYTGNALANSSNGSLGTLSNNILASQLNKTRALSDAYSKVADVNRNEDKTAQQFNLGVDQVNMGQYNMEKDINARNRAAYTTEKSKLLGQIGTDLGSIGKEQVFKKQAEKMTGYSWMGDYIMSNPEYKSQFDAIDKSNLSEQEKYAKKQILTQNIFKGMTPEQIAMYNQIQSEVGTMGHPQQTKKAYGGYITPKFKKY